MLNADIGRRRKNASNTPDWLRLLEKAQSQYQRYLEISGLYELPTVKEEKPVTHTPPSIENPLTTNTARAK